jgi:hypothetical protein
MSFLYAVLTSIVLALTGQTEIPYTGIEKAFSAGNAAEITAMGKDKMMLNVLGKEAVYSQSQATMVLRDFFTKKPVVSFKFVFKGKETPEGSYAIGNYESKTESFRVTVQFKKITSDYKIESLSIEK